MALRVTNFAKQLRNRFLRETTESLTEIQGGLSYVKNELNAIKHTQLQVNHNQLEKLNELSERVKNSGTIRVSEREIIAKIFSGIKIYLDTNDLAVAPHIALDGVWEHRITAAWLSVVRPRDTVIDIGANFGYFAALAAQHTDKKHSKVILFEANRNLIPFINKTLSINWFHEQCIVENLAVADKPGMVTLQVLKDYIGSSSLHSIEHTKAYMKNKMELEAEEVIPVEAVALDEYCKNNKIATVDLIKMDIEGYEDKAYQGMRKIVAASPEATLFIEFTKDSYEAPELFYEQMLNDFGHVYVIDDDGYIIKPKNPSYKIVVGDADDWVMPIFSKRADLANRG